MVVGPISSVAAACRARACVAIGSLAARPPARLSQVQGQFAAAPVVGAHHVARLHPLADHLGHGAGPAHLAVGCAGGVADDQAARAAGPAAGVPAPGAHQRPGRRAHPQQRGRGLDGAIEQARAGSRARPTGAHRAGPGHPGGQRGQGQGAVPGQLQGAGAAQAEGGDHDRVAHEGGPARGQHLPGLAGHLTPRPGRPVGVAAHLLRSPASMPSTHKVVTESGA